MNMRVNELADQVEKEQQAQGGQEQPARQRGNRGQQRRQGGGQQQRGQQQPRQAGGQPQRGQRGQQRQNGDGSQPSPEQQEAFDRVVTAGIQVLNKATDQVMQHLEQQSDNMPKAIADTTLLIVTQLDEKSGGSIPRDVLFHAAVAILEEVTEYALQAGIGEIDERVQMKAAQLLMSELANRYPQEMMRFLEGGSKMIEGMPDDQLAQIMEEQAQAAQAGKPQQRGQGGGAPRGGGQQRRQPQQRGSPGGQQRQRPQQGVVARRMQQQR